MKSLVDLEMTLDEALELLPEHVLIAMAQGFKAGILGPKKYKPNNWKDLDVSAKDMLPSYLGHIAQTEKREADPDTGYPPYIFEGARAVMHIYFAMEEYDEENKTNS